MELTQNEQEMSACYHIGRYSVSGDWIAEAIPEAAQTEVNHTQVEFHKKLVKTLRERFEITVSVASESADFA
ncbi:transcriptional regulator Crl [Vibrio mimicus VM223]|nr:transcriptional regulator Crl [Vibrio mimicus VM223]